MEFHSTDSPWLLRFARASADVDAARALLIENAHRFSHVPVDQMAEMDRIKCRRDQAFALRDRFSALRAA